jgi:hypothetical protein
MRVTTGLALVAVVLVLAGCGSSGPGQVTAGTASHQPGADAYRYARCMRSHGVPNFPDPHVSVSAGSTRISQMAPASAVDVPKFKTAQKACGGIIPGPGSSHSDQGGPSRAVLLAFARCLRSHGLSGFPDPGRDGRITSQMISASGVQLRSPVFLSAARACIGVTHGAITPADIRAAINGPH